MKNQSFAFSFLFFLIVPFAQAQSQQPTKLVREARIQSFLQTTKAKRDIYDPAINSPKSALFSLDGRKLYINSLEGAETVVYNWPELTKRKVIRHFFDSRNQALFRGEETVFDYPYYQKLTNHNIFHGKPVEMAFSHGGKYLWITYYRRDYDPSAQSPSAVAIIDTASDAIVRVMPTGPIPKFVAISPDGKMAAITHWGDNTVALIDISSSSVEDFKYTTLLTVERKLSQEDMAGKDRDSACGLCLRGTAFSPDSRTLFVARMGGGGLAGFDLSNNTYLGTVTGMRPTPRHLAITPDNQSLIISSNQAGYITKYNIEELIRAFRNANGKKIIGPMKSEVSVGGGARTIELDPSGETAYVAVNNGVKVVAVDLNRMTLVAEASLDPFPVGLAVSPDGSHLVVTSQGHSGQGGGNSVNVVRIER